MMISCIRYTNRLLAMLSLTASLAIVVSSCNTSDVEIEKPSTGKVTVELALNVSTQQSTATNTRMTADAVQVNGNFRGIQDWHLIPFAITTSPLPTTPIAENNTPLPGVITSLHNTLEISRTNEKYYLDQNVIDATIGTNAYLCYARAGRADNTDDFDNGSTVASFDVANYSGGYSTDQITFSPEQICSANNFSNNANGTALLAYLNGIARSLLAGQLINGVSLMYLGLFLMTLDWEGFSIPWSITMRTPKPTANTPDRVSASRLS